MTNNTRSAQHEHSFTEQPISLTRTKASKQEKDRVFVALRNNGYPKNIPGRSRELRKRARRTEFVPSPEELVRMFLKMLNQKIIPATRSSPTLTAQRNP